MRGSLPIDIPVPLNGLMRDRPTQQVPLDGIVSGYNMMVDVDGYYRPRPGYVRWLTSNPSESLIGLNFYEDTDGSLEYVGAGPTQIWVAQNRGAWTSMGGSLTGALTDLVSVVPFLQPFVDGAATTFLSALIANNHDPIMMWNQQLHAAQPLTPIHSAGSGNTLAFNTTPAFTSYLVGNPGPAFFFTVTAGNTGNTTLNINGIGAQPLRYLLNGVVTELPSGFLGSGTIFNAAWDGTEFLIGSNVPAPIARSIFAMNGRIVAVNVQSGNVRVPSQVTWSAAFDGSVWPADAFQNMVDTDDPLIGGAKIGFNAAVIYGEQSGYSMNGVYGAGDANAFSFTPINGYVTGPVSPLAIVPYQGGHLYLARDFRIWYTDGINAQPFNGAISALLQSRLDPSVQETFFAFQDIRQRRIWFFGKQIGDSTSSAAVLALDPQPHYETLQTFPTLFTAGAAPVVQDGVRIEDLTQPISFYTQPINSFLNQAEIINFVADASAVYIMGPAAGALDNGQFLVNYAYSPGLLTQGPAMDIRPESFDLFLQSTPYLELGTVQFDLLKYPDDPGTTILAAPLVTNDPASFTLPQVTPEMTSYARYIRMTVSGNSLTRALAFGGARVYCNVQGRPSA